MDRRAIGIKEVEAAAGTFVRGVRDSKAEVPVAHEQAQIDIRPGDLAEAVEEGNLIGKGSVSFVHGGFVAAEAHDFTEARKGLDEFGPGAFQTDDGIAAAGGEEFDFAHAELGGGVADAEFRLVAQQIAPARFEIKGISGHKGIRG